MGNIKADKAAKHAALLLVQEISIEKGNITMEILMALQNQVGPQTHSKWKNAGCKQINNVWKHEYGRLCAPPSLYPILANLSHLPSHISKGGMIASVHKFWFAPGFTQFTTEWCKKCMICAKHNPGKLTKVEMKHLVKPDYPFQRLQIDFIQLPKCGVYEYVLVCVDMFSSWIEAWPVAKATAAVTAKKLMSEVVCRFGLPETVESDRGTHFTGQVFTEMLKGLQINQHLHTPYHPQSSGKVERANGVLKNKIAKICEQTKLTWVQALPLALFAMRHTPKGLHGLSPFEIVWQAAADRPFLSTRITWTVCLFN